MRAVRNGGEIRGPVREFVGSPRAPGLSPRPQVLVVARPLGTPRDGERRDPLSRLARGGVTV